MVFIITFLHELKFKRLFHNLEVHVKEEGKTDSSWLMGYLQGLGNRYLTGYQAAALVDLLLVHPVAAPEEVAPDVLSQKPVGKVNFRP